jgi:predicted LPLAT superfamily acyltransferase
MSVDTPKSQSWTSRSHGSRWQHEFFYILIRIFGRISAYIALYPIVLSYVIFSSSVRKKSQFYLKHRFPNGHALGYLKHTFHLCIMLGKTLIDRAAMGILGPKEFSVSFEDRQMLLGLLREDTGLVLINAHLGCWQVAMAELQRVKRPVTLLMHRDQGDVDKHYFEQAGMDCPYTIVDPAGPFGGTLEVLAALQKGHVVSIMGDRIFGNRKNALSVDFLGEPALFPISPYKIAASAGAPCIFFFTEKTGFRTYRLRIFKCMDIPSQTGLRDEAYRPYVETFVRAMETYCQDNPYQFFNFFNMWE